MVEPTGSEGQAAAPPPLQLWVSKPPAGCPVCLASEVQALVAGYNTPTDILLAASVQACRLVDIAILCWYPPLQCSPLLNFIGPPWRAPVATAVTAGSAAGASDNKTLPDGSTPSSLACASWMVEAAGSGVALQPPDLHLAMRSRRLLHRGLL